MASLSGATLLSVGVLLAVSFLIGELFERIGLESILGYIVAGVFLGPGIANLASYTSLISEGWAISASSVAGFATVGATLILFQAGLKEENVVDIFTHREGLQLGTAILVGTFAVIFSTLYFLQPSYLPDQGAVAFLFIALAYAVVDIGVPSKLMMSKGLLREHIGKYTIKSSVINVTLGFIALTALVVYATQGLESKLIKIGSILGFIAVFYVLHEFIHKIDDYIMMFEETEAQFAITFSLLLFMSYISQTVGLSSVLGAFFAGVIVSRSDFTDSRAFQEKISAIAEGLFIPIFFAWFGLGLTIFGSSGMIANIDAAFLLFVLSTVPKIGIGYVVSKLHDIEKPMTVAASLLSLDIETLVVLIIAIDLGVISEQMLQVFAPAVLFSTLTIILMYTFLDRE
jgi:Kef-type K+ transport system membrane component KefB